MTAGYGGGSIMLRVTREGDRFGVKTLYRYGPDGGLASEQQTPILYDGALFGSGASRGRALRPCTVPLCPTGGQSRPGVNVWPYL